MTNKKVKPYKSTERDPRVILPRSEFFNLSYDEKRYLMSYWRENFTTNAILKGMGYNNSTSLYKTIKRLGLPTDLRKHKDLMMQEELQQLTKMPEETKEVIRNVAKDTVEIEDEEQEVETLVQLQQAKDKEETQEEEQKVQNEEETVNSSQVVNNRQEVKTNPIPNTTKLPTIRVELTGDITLTQIQKVLQFAEETNLAIRVQG